MFWVESKISPRCFWDVACSAQLLLKTNKGQFRFCNCAWFCACLVGLRLKLNFHGLDLMRNDLCRELQKRVRYRQRIALSLFLDFLGNYLCRSKKVMVLEQKFVVLLTQHYFRNNIAHLKQLFFSTFQKVKEILYCFSLKTKPWCHTLSNLLKITRKTLLVSLYHQKIDRFRVLLITAG